MERIVRSLREYKLTRSVRNLLRQLPAGLQSSDLAVTVNRLFEADLIGYEDMLYLKSKLLLNRFCRETEGLIEGVSCGIYLYEDAVQKMWVGAAPNVPAAYTEYAHGLSGLPDVIRPDDALPQYLYEPVPVRDVRHSEDAVALNHREALLASGLRSFCCIPIAFGAKRIGHAVLFGHEPRDWAPFEIAAIIRQAAQVERHLASFKDEVLEMAQLGRLKA